jgi:hypothetical protein
MWSVPLIAAVAVIGALAMFVMLTPNQAAADEREGHGEPGPVTGLMAAVATGTDTDGQPAGRTQINLSWMMPDGTMGDPAESYRIDYSDDTRVWKNLVGGEESDEMLSNLAADANCVSATAGDMRCYTDITLEPGETRHYRVFAVNEFGTSPLSVEPGYATATTIDYARPSAALGLTATTTLEDRIVLDWQPPTDLGGATLAWYCLAVGPSQAAIHNPADNPVATAADICLNATEETDEDDVPVFDGATFGAASIAIPAGTTMFTHTGLDSPDTVSLYYRVYAVTDKDGDEDTANTPADGTDAVTDDRRISLAASNVANGRTVASQEEINTEVTETPDPVTYLRYVASRAEEDDVTLSLYWTLPDNYPGPPDTGEEDERDNWIILVERWDATDEEWMVVAGDVPGATIPAQWVSAATDETNTAEQLFQVRYVNNPTEGEVPDPDSDDAPGTVTRFRVAQTTAERYAADQLPVINAANNDLTTGLRFSYNQLNPTTWLDLKWDPNMPSNEDNEDNDDIPTGYVIDVTEATTIDKSTRWMPLDNAKRPSDLGSTTQYTHKGVTPGKLYTYRVFPEFGTHNVNRYGYRYGPPATEAASSREADLPGPVRGLMVVADPDDPQTALKLNWPAVPDDRAGHPILAYLVEVANDKNNDTTLDPTAMWHSITIPEDTTTPTTPAMPWTVDADTSTYTYESGTNDGFLDTLGAGEVRWFRVIAINAENDGEEDTGGTAINPATGFPNGAPSPSEADPPHPADELSALPAYGMTDAPAAPDDPSQVMMPPAPVDLTAEKASDTNLPDTTDRGVLLLWNEPESSDGINNYLVQRKIGTGGWVTIGRVSNRTSFSDSREYIDGEDLSYQVGSQGASTVAPSYTTEVVYPTTHPEGRAVVLTAPTMVEASSDAAGELTLTWQGAANVDSYILIAVNTTDFTYERADVSDGVARSGTVTGLTPGANYIGIVVALKGSGDDLEILHGSSSAMPVQ